MRTKFEDIPDANPGLDPKDPAQAVSPQGSLTNWLNVPVVRCDQVWLDQSHKVRCPALLIAQGTVDRYLTSVR